MICGCLAFLKITENISRRISDEKTKEPQKYLVSEIMFFILLLKGKIILINS